MRLECSVCGFKTNDNKSRHNEICVGEMRDVPCPSCKSKDSRIKELEEVIREEPCECLDEYGEKFRIDCWRCIALRSKAGKEGR